MGESSHTGYSMNRGHTAKAPELKYYESSSSEWQFVETAKRYRGQEGRLPDQQESELEGLYKTKEEI